MATTTRLAMAIAAAPADVYRALIDPADVSIWMVPDGMTSRLDAFEPRVGGRFRITLTYDAPDGGGKTTSASDSYGGEFVALQEGELVVQRMAFETDDPTMRGEMTVTFRISGTDRGTMLEATHAGVPPGIAPELNELGWRLSLEKLARLLEGR